MRKKIVGLLLVIAAASFGFTACGSTDADVASENLSKAAEQFEIDRHRVIFKPESIVPDFDRP